MRVTVLLPALIVPFGAFAAPVEVVAGHIAVERQARPVKPNPCEPIVPAPTEEETKARHAKFADAFIYKKNITAAFEFINKSYIVSPILWQRGGAMLITGVHEILRTIIQSLKMDLILLGIFSVRFGNRRTSRRFVSRSKVIWAG